MKKYLFTILFSVFTCLLLAQDENIFEDYLSHYKEIQLPYNISLDSTRVIFPEGSIIPEDYILKYVCEPGKPCDDNPLKYWYRYGIRVTLGDYVGVILSKDCDAYDECTTEFGIGIVRCLLIVYSSEGYQISQSVISQISDQHFGYVTFAENDNPCELLSISTKQGTLSEYDKERRIYQGLLDYCTYTINQKGEIRKDKTMSSNIRVKWGILKVNILEEW